MKCSLIHLSFFALIISAFGGCATEMTESRATFMQHDALWGAHKLDEAAALVQLDGQGLDTSSADVCIMLARACEIRDDPEGEKRWAMKALELEPDRQEAMSRYSTACETLCDYQEGVRFAREMMDRHKNLNATTLGRFATHFYYKQLHEEGFNVAALAYWRDRDSFIAAGVFFRLGFRVRPLESMMLELDSWMSKHKATAGILRDIGVGVSSVNWDDKERADLALSYLEKAWEAGDRTHILIQYTISNLRTIGDLERAKLFVKAVQDEQIVERYLLVTYAAIHNDKKNWVMAHEINLKAMEVFPDNPQIAGNHVFYLWRLKRYNEALDFGNQWLIRGLDVKPNLYQGMGHSLCNLGRYEEAERSYRLAHEIEPDYPNYVRDIVWSMSHQGRSAAAVAFGRSWLAGHPDLDDADLDMVRRAIARAWADHVR